MGIAQDVEAVRQRLIETSKVQVGWGNYQEVLHTYLKITNDALICVRKLAEAVAALPPSTPQSSEGKGD